MRIRKQTLHVKINNHFLIRNFAQYQIHMKTVFYLDRVYPFTDCKRSRLSPIQSQE